MLTLPLRPFVTTISSLPSPLKSAVATAIGEVPAASADGTLHEAKEVGLVVSKSTTFDAPPPGVGLTTVIDAVLALAMSEARMVAVNCELLTTVVARDVPFHFTVEPGTKPVPRSVSVKAAPRGGMAAGL